MTSGRLIKYIGAQRKIHALFELLTASKYYRFKLCVSNPIFCKFTTTLVKYVDLFIFYCLTNSIYYMLIRKNHLENVVMDEVNVFKSMNNFWIHCHNSSGCAVFEVQNTILIFKYKYPETYLYLSIFIKIYIPIIRCTMEILNSRKDRSRRAIFSHNLYPEWL